MVGSIGMVRSISRPNSLVIQEALNLLSALGSDGKGTTKKLLVEMKDVQDNNVSVLADVKEEVAKADKRGAEIVEKEVELARNLREAEALYNGRLLEIINSEEKLQHREEEADARISEQDESISEREGELHRGQEEHQESLRKSSEYFSERERVLGEDREALKELESSCEGRVQEIENDKIALDDLRGSLDKYKVKLDKRDARVRAAMEDEAVVDGG